VPTDTDRQTRRLETEAHATVMLPIAVLILTKNEQQDLPACLESVRWCDDIHVLDSLSTDDTVVIAQSFGAHVVARAFDGYASQRNFGLHNIAYRHPWVLILDADERIPSSLLDHFEKFIATAGADVAAVRIRRRDFWWDTWLKHAQLSPYFLRLVRPERVRYEREVNEVLIVDGATRDLDGYFDHYPFSKGLDHWIAKHNTYSRIEAELIVGGGLPKPSWRIAVFGRDFNERRKHQKGILYALPGRPFIKLTYMILFRRAFLDGWAGVRYSILQAVYEYFIVVKTKELKQRAATACRPSQS
jgi:glycosyltransferase involved in cell wall biosynthesis